MILHLKLSYTLVEFNDLDKNKTHSIEEQFNDDEDSEQTSVLKKWIF